MSELEHDDRGRGEGLMWLAMLLVVALYFPTFTRGLIDYDDPWLIKNNVLVQHPSLHAIFLDTSTATRYGLGAEYLPIRDLSVALDFMVWDRWYQGFHITNVILYVLALPFWFGALCRFGASRMVAGIAILIFAVHPSHAESVAWLSERKGVLALLFTGAAYYTYARYRASEAWEWIIPTTLAAVAAVWSKAPSAFALAALAAFELAPGRVSWRRSAIGLAIVGAATAAAFIPVVMTANAMGVVGSSGPAPAGWGELVLGVHGFYVELAAMAMPNAISYPIASDGPSTIELTLGVVALAGVFAAIISPRPILRAAGVLWLVSWFPNSRIALPVVKVLVADRYLMFGSLAFAIAVAVGIVAIPRAWARMALVAAVVVAGSLRTLDAQSSWADSLALQTRAVRSNPNDGVAWSFYADALATSGHQDLADRAVAEGLRHSHDPALVHRDALFRQARGDKAGALAQLRAAADAGYATAMSNLALMLQADGKLDEALLWARRATDAEPMKPNGYRILGVLLLAVPKNADALAAFERAYALEPANLQNRLNLGVALTAVGRTAEALPHLEAALQDPELAPRARALLAPADRH